MTEEYRHTDFQEMMSAADCYRNICIAYEASTRSTSAILLLILGGIGFIGVWNIWFLLVIVPLSINVLDGVLSWWRFRKVFRAMKQPLYRAFEGLKEAKFYSTCQEELWEINLMGMFGPDKTKIRKLESGTEGFEAHL